MIYFFQYFQYYFFQYVICIKKIDTTYLELVGHVIS